MIPSPLFDDPHKISPTRPVDRLAQVRQAIRDLRAEERALREQILTGEADRLGEHYVARVSKHVVLVAQHE